MSFLALVILFKGRNKRLCTDNHYIDAGAGREIVQFVQVGAVVDKESCLLSVLLHKVVSGNLEGLIDTFTDSNTRNDNNKLTPTVTLVQFKHHFDVNVGFTCTCFHFDVERAATDVADGLVGYLDVVLILNGADVFKKLVVAQPNRFIFITGITQKLHLFVGNGKSYLL